MEVCVDNARSALNAVAGGARRLELCSSLVEGGLTPSPGMLKHLKQTLPETCIFVLIRPRGGDFLFDNTELRIMQEDIRILSQNGADGFVFGCLTSDGHVDESACRVLKAVCEGKPMTFHRAFDMVADPLRTAKTLIDLGFHRILSSGQSPSAWEGRLLLRSLVEAVGDEIVVMPGGGISSDNLEDILVTTRCKEFHASARETVQSKMLFRNEMCSMGSNSEEFTMKVTSMEKVSSLVKLFAEVQQRLDQNMSRNIWNEKDQ
ncbi:hypothetical protein TCAL_01373 [Tigriopus californicus]|uniref:Copper homeostasis protein cutC homolog n=2 Tax=Tigriopus californicus TaxID=6832 RepID=A0A553NUQ8_TIGCA|nr:hypothetical protein TCAL_01373 [Tigriopus californicus]|eukprot:TCALIF_01373-PA protein Name:"Similar to CUTC Copper homeostasis protein cutC homolog (Homo sapiens)" AED:0.04 eAED:0.04 QI:0/-1/0/1/-1/1/1/0/261